MALVNQTTGNSEGAGTTVASSAFNATAGNLIAVAAGTYFTTAVVSSVTDTAGNTYVKAVERKTNGSMEIWYAKNITGHATNVVTVTYTASVGSRRSCCVSQFSGRDLTTPVSATATAAATAVTSVTSGSFTPTAGADCFAGLQTQGATSAITAGTNYGNVQSAGDDTASEVRANTTATSQTAGISWTTASDVDFAVVAFQVPQVVSISGTPALAFGPSGTLVTFVSVSGSPALAFGLSGAMVAHGLVNGATRYFEGRILDAIFRSALPYQPQLYLALFTTAPTDDGGGIEVAGGNYTRLVLERGDDLWTAPAGNPFVVKNVQPIEWQDVTWSGTVVAWGIFDAPAGGNLLLHYDCFDVVVATGNTLRLDPQMLTVGFD